MAHRRQEIEEFVRQIVVEVEAAEATGMTTPQAIADHFNAIGVTTRKGWKWTSATVEKFLSSPIAIRHRMAETIVRIKNPNGIADQPSQSFGKVQLRRLSGITIAHYDRVAEDYWHGTRHHDVSQNTGAFLEAIEGSHPYTILDLGCGPGRDLQHFNSLGHNAVGLDGSETFVSMARFHSGCEVLHQDFIAMTLPENHFDGVFANASLFHIPSQELPKVLLKLSKALTSGGVLFCSNPRGNNDEGLSNDRYSCFFNLDTWRNYVIAAGFVELRCYFRPPGLPRHRQPWLATVWRKGDGPKEQPA